MISLMHCRLFIFFYTDDQIIANVSVKKMDLEVNGESKRALQIGTVMTHPEHRGKGLSKSADGVSIGYL